MLSPNLAIMSDFMGVKVLPKNSETLKQITKLAKEHKMFLLVSYQGVKYYITEEQSNLDTFKTSINKL